MFANSAAETKTTTEKGFVDSFAKQIGDIGAIMIAILSAVLFTILLVVGQHDGAVGPRAHERAGRAEDARVLERAVLTLVLGESVFIALLGGGAGPRHWPG